jgi:hypothetical protein
VPANIGGATFALTCLRFLDFGLISSSSEVVTERARFRDLTGAVEDWCFTVLAFPVAGEKAEAQLAAC